VSGARARAHKEERYDLFFRTSGGLPPLFVTSHGYDSVDEWMREGAR